MERNKRYKPRSMVGRIYATKFLRGNVGKDWLICSGLISTINFDGSGGEAGVEGAVLDPPGVAEVEKVLYVGCVGFFFGG